MRSKRFRDRGFTLIEVLISLAIGSILIGLAFMSLRNIYKTQSISSETANIAGVLRAAQEKSFSQENGSRWGVYFRNNVGAAVDYYYLIEVDEDLIDDYELDKLVMPATQILEQTRLPSSLDFSTPSAVAGGLVVIFSKITGKSAFGNVDVEITNGETIRTISIDSAGKVEF